MAKTTLEVWDPVVSGCRDAYCTGLGVVSPLALPMASLGDSVRGLGGAPFAKVGAAGGRDDALRFIGVLLITFDLGFAGGTGAVVLSAIFAEGRAEAVSLRLGLRATLTGALLDVLRFATARRLRSLLGGTSLMVSKSLSYRARSTGGRGLKSLLTGIRLGGAKSHEPTLGIKTREAASMLRDASPSPKLIRSTSK